MVHIHFDGPVRVVKGDGWRNLEDRKYETGKVIEIRQGQWHRLIGLDSWGRIAEIWQHTDPDRLSDEDDIFRVQDKYGRADQQADPSTPIEERDKKWQDFLLGIL